MATEKYRTFDLHAGAIHVVIENAHGHESRHTIYVVGVEDINAHVQQLMADVDSHANLIMNRMKAAGYQVGK
jgi:hypothetical protein